MTTTEEPLDKLVTVDQIDDVERYCRARAVMSWGNKERQRWRRLAETERQRKASERLADTTQ